MKLTIAEISSGKVTFAIGPWDVTAELRGSAQALDIATDEGVQVEARALSLERVQARHGVRRIEATRAALDGTLRIVDGRLAIEASQVLFEGLSYRDPALSVRVKRFELAQGATLVEGALATPLVVARGVEIVRETAGDQLRVDLQSITASDVGVGETLDIAALRLEGLSGRRGEEQFTFQRADVTVFSRERPQNVGAHTLQLDELMWKEGTRTFDIRRVSARDAQIDLSASHLHFVAGSSRDAKLADEGLQVTLEKLELPQGGQADHPRGLLASEARFEGFALSWLVAGEGSAASTLGQLLAKELAESSASEGKDVELEDEALRELAGRLAKDGLELVFGGWSLGAASAAMQASHEIRSRLLLQGREARRLELQLGGAKLAELELKPTVAPA